MVEGKDDFLQFADDDLTDTKTEVAHKTIPQETWKILIVDDEQEVHSITNLVLADYSFEGKKLSFASAFSGEEAKKYLETTHNVALILLDVVMETDDAGLNLVKYIRDVLKNHFVRIILRTGQPGHAPEQDVIVNYDINDYKSKVELTTQKLFTTVTSSLRSYRDICALEKNRKGLEKIIHASSNLFEINSLNQFASGVLNQLTAILQLDEDSMYLHASGFAASKEQGNFKILAGGGQFEKGINHDVDEVIDASIREEIYNAVAKKQGFFADDHYIGFFESQNGSQSVLYLKESHPLSNLDKNLVRLFATNVAIAFDNIHLNREIVETQKEVIYTLGEVVETRSKETANHVRRVAEMAFLLAVKAGLSEEECEALKSAAPMHDVGKIGISDLILHKPGKLTNEEFDLIKSHTTIGYDILKNSTRKIMLTAAIVAHEHHEKWNGKGYPRGLKDEEIHIFGRITAIADVVDAVSHKRCYKDAWPWEKVLDLVKNDAGQHFDPNLVELFLKHEKEFQEILKKFPN